MNPSRTRSFVFASVALATSLAACTRRAEPDDTTRPLTSSESVSGTGSSDWGQAAAGSNSHDGSDANAVKGSAARGTTASGAPAGSTVVGNASLPAGFEFQALPVAELPACPATPPVPTYPDGAWSVADLRCAKAQIGNIAFTLKGTVVRLSRCHCDEDVACGPCVDAHWIADSAEPGAYVLVQGTYPDEWQLGSIVQVKLKAYQWETPPLPVASTSWAR